MNWAPMTLDELASSRQAEAFKLVKLDGIWWVEIRPFFFRPLFPFREIKPGSKRYPLKSYLGGVLHLVPPGDPANSSMSFFVHEELKSYSLDALNHRRRRLTREAIRNFTAKVITDQDEFIATAYDVYLSFYKRTGYSYKKERVGQEAFADWAAKLFSNDKILKLGAYHNGRLCAIEISYYVEDVIIADTMFADDMGLELKVTDFVMHTMREAAARTDARYFYGGLPSGVESLDESKRLRGYKVLTLPARFRINPLALPVAKIVMRSSYEKLLKITAPGASEVSTG